MPIPQTDNNAQTIFMNMENGTAIKMNGHAGGTFTNTPDNIKSLSNSKMSLQSLRSNASTNSQKAHMNGYSSTQSLAEPMEEKEIFIVMEPSDRRFGFSVMGGIDEGFPPRIDNISPASPAERFDLRLDDEIIEVNGLNVESVTHAEIIMHIHKSKKSITLRIRRYLPSTLPRESNGEIHEMAIDVPDSYINKTNGEASPQTRVDGMLKFRLHPKAEVPNRESNIPSKFVNEAFEHDSDDEGAVIDITPRETDQPKSFGFSQFVTTLDTIKGKLKTPKQQDDLYFIQKLLNSKQFKSAVKTHNRMTRIQMAKKGLETIKPVATNSLFLLTEVRLLLMEMQDESSVALNTIINKPEFKELLNAHDRITMRESITLFADETDSLSEADYDSEIDDITRNDEQHVKIVRIDKTNEPLGATVRNEGDAVIISRIVKGGAAEKSGLLHEGDEILEINDNSVRGKDVNEVVEILIELEGTLTFVLIPGQTSHKETLRDDGHTVMKALFDYTPKEDDYNPCQELGLNFMKGDLLEILNQTDPDWWQAQFVEKKQGGLAGLIPSKHFQLQRELAKITLKGDDDEPILQEKKRCFCGRARRKGKKVPMKSMNAPVQESEILTYEEMVRMFPDVRKRRPVVLIGPPQVGRREIRERLINEYPERFAAAVPHTTRAQNNGEVSGVDYTFVQRNAFEKSIGAADFIEHGVFSNDYYGTSFSAVDAIIKEGKTCVLNMYCQALPVLKNSHLRPYVVFITVPRIDQLKRLREFDDTCEPFNPHVRLKDNELDDLVEKARDMHRTHGHYFDKTLFNSDLDKTFDELLAIFDSLEQDPQWIYSSWVR